MLKQRESERGKERVRKIGRERGDRRDRERQRVTGSVRETERICERDKESMRE